MWKEYNITNANSEFTAEDFTLLQNHYLKQIIRHNHPVIKADNIKISEMSEEQNPVGLVTPIDDSVLTWQDHVNLAHTKTLTGGRLLARGYTVPIKARFVITTPIMDSTANLPFPTYNMSTETINKSIASSDVMEQVPPNRHDHSAYTNYRHYLWILPMNSVCQIHPSHKTLISGDIGSLVFSHIPLYIHPSNTDLLKSIMDSTNTPNYRGLTYIPDYAEEKIWSLTDDSTCWMTGYKPIVANNNKDIMLFFNDYYNEFNQILSILNYEEQFREYMFRLEKSVGNVTRLENTDISDITKLMESKRIDVLDAPEHSGIIFDSIKKKYSPFSLFEYNFKTDRVSDRLKDTLIESCMEKQAKNVTFYTKGLSNFTSVIEESEFLHDLYIPSYFEDGYRQCLILTGELGVSSRSFKKLHKGRVMLAYQIIDGFISVPYEIYSYDTKSTGTTSNEILAGTSVGKSITDVTRMDTTETLCK